MRWHCAAVAQDRCRRSPGV